MSKVKTFLRTVVDMIIKVSLFFVPRKKHSKKQVLILRKDGLGDCLLFYPLLTYFREHYRDSEMTLVFPAYLQSLASLFADMDRVVWFNHKKFSTSFVYRWKFFYFLKRSGFDVAIYPVYTREPIGDLMMHITGASEIIGFAKNGRLYTKHIQVPDTMTSELDRNVYFTEQVIGQMLDGIHFPTIDVTQLDRAGFDTLVKEHQLNEKKYAVIFPGSGAAYKNWPPERFADVISYLVAQNITPIICGSEREKIIADEIVASLSDDAKMATLIFSGKTDLPTLAHILAGALFYFGSDTGILHLATAVGTPTIALVGSGARGRFFPYGDERKNRMLYDVAYPATGEWDVKESERLGSDVHPSILGITVSAAVEEITDMLAVYY